MKKQIILGTLLSFIATFSWVGLADAHCHKKWEDKDTNKDGAVDLQELTAAKMKRFDAKDTNKDGSISKDEMKAHVQDKFNKIDANKDGKITKEEKQAYKEAKCKK
ncbi:MAG: hypothetical protein R3351_02895 [Nitrospirales bacterium]|nr:hypothetical protein [Nitrospirales bacterium]